jgi:hypothetical protein
VLVVRNLDDGRIVQVGLKFAGMGERLITGQPRANR